MNHYSKGIHDDCSKKNKNCLCSQSDLSALSLNENGDWNKFCNVVVKKIAVGSVCEKNAYAQKYKIKMRKGVQDWASFYKLIGRKIKAQTLVNAAFFELQYA